ncbi:MAG: GatB/YqeY domain-containing protein, partial [Bacteroidaceae bacterium]|nr:GatB/YqeY domain-containing protein [Bacteroidaceae bacterium]
YDKAGNTEMLNKEKGELAVVEEFTPAQPTEEEMTDYVNMLIDKHLSERGAGYKLQQRDMGVLMKGAKEKYPNISGNIVKSALEARMN